MTARALALVGLLTLGPAARAEEPAPTAPAFHDDPGLVVPLRIGERGLILLSDGRAVEGRVVLLDRHGVTLRVDDPRPSRAPSPAAILRLSPAESSALHPPVRVVLADGSVVSGELSRRDEAGLTLAGPGGTRSFAAPQVCSLHPVVWSDAPLRTEARYLEVPSALLPRQGNVRLSLLEGTHALATWAPLDAVVVELGTAVPILHLRGEPFNAQAALRAGLPITPWLAVAAGAHLEISRTGRQAGRLSATVTATANVFSATLHAGPTFSAANWMSSLGDLAWAGAFGARVSRNVDLVAELWIRAPNGLGDGRAGTAALRWRGSFYALDLGVAGGDVRGPVPWLGFTMDVAGR